MASEKANSLAIITLRTTARMSTMPTMLAKCGLVEVLQWSSKSCYDVYVWIILIQQINKMLSFCGTAILLNNSQLQFRISYLNLLALLLQIEHFYMSFSAFDKVFKRSRSSKVQSF